jgi:hypothetical protein
MVTRASPKSADDGKFFTALLAKVELDSDMLAVVIELLRQKLSCVLLE